MTNTKIMMEELKKQDAQEWKIKELVISLENMFMSTTKYKAVKYLMKLNVGLVSIGEAKKAYKIFNK